MDEDAKMMSRPSFLDKSWTSLISDLAEHTNSYVHERFKVLRRTADLNNQILRKLQVLMIFRK
jgi:hypothetical protein